MEVGDKETLQHLICFKMNLPLLECQWLTCEENMEYDIDMYREEFKDHGEVGTCRING